MNPDSHSAASQSAASRAAWNLPGRNFPVRVLIYLINLYRHMVSPLRLPTCRFIPTCSEYAVDALAEYGLVRGSGLTLVRLAKCGPWHKGGWDPIPDRCTDLHRTQLHGTSRGAEVRSTNV